MAEIVGMHPNAPVSVIIPTHNGASTLAACLESLRASFLPPYEIIVVDDASSDQSAEIARRFQCRVIRADENMGAARAKNRGAAAAAGEILFFTDDDVIVSNEMLAQIAEDLKEARVVGVVGLLDRNIPFRDFASNFKNLWMRFSYARLPRERIGVFYTSVAAIRREIFLALGGFDENYRGASIAEDTEFGQRALNAGYSIVLDSRVEVKHCKHYSLPQVLVTDFLRARALTLLRLRKWGQKFFTSVPAFYQLAVPTIFAALVSLVLAAIFRDMIFFAATCLLLALFYPLNASWLAYLAHERGVLFALRAVLFQPVDVIVAGFGMVVAAIEFACGVRY